jgi:hypothetical protein
MDEYLHYLNTFKHGSSSQYELKRNYPSGRYAKDRAEGRYERDSRKRKQAKDYKDLDNPNDNMKSSLGRQLISYDDL